MTVAETVDLTAAKWYPSFIATEDRLPEPHVSTDTHNIADVHAHAYI